MLCDGNYQFFVGFEYIAAERFVDLPVPPSAEYQCGTLERFITTSYRNRIHSVSQSLAQII